MADEIFGRPADKQTLAGDCSLAPSLVPINGLADQPGGRPATGPQEANSNAHRSSGRGGGG